MPIRSVPRCFSYFSKDFRRPKGGSPLLDKQMKPEGGTVRSAEMRQRRCNITGEKPFDI
jgi:hypothetical protein